MDSVLKKVVSRIVETATPDKIILFGSRGKGSFNNDSDYDILVLKTGVSDRRALAHQIYRDLMDVAASVDVLVETPERFEEYRSLSGSVYSDAAEGLVVYER